MADVRFTRSIDKDHLARLKQAREEADAAYNAALSALDAALPAPRAVPDDPTRPDETQITPLNERYAIVAGMHPPSGIKNVVLRQVWSWLAPVFARQEAFNATLVDHVNRNVAATRSLHEAQTGVLAALRDEFQPLS